jgi:hypothetical protein
MVVNQIDIEGVTILEAENDPPVSPYGNAPELLEITFQTMEFKSGQVQVFRLSRPIQNEKDVFHFFEVIRVNTFDFTLFE